MRNAITAPNAWIEIMPMTTQSKRTKLSAKLAMLLDVKRGMEMGWRAGGIVVPDSASIARVHISAKTSPVASGDNDAPFTNIVPVFKRYQVVIVETIKLAKHTKSMRSMNRERVF